MHCFNVFFALAALLALTLADGAAIITAMQKIQTDTIALKSTIASYTGNPLTSVKILVQSIKLLKTIEDGTETAQASAELTVNEALTLAVETTKLGTVVQSSLDTISRKKKTFQKNLLQPVVLITLKQQQEATENFSTAVVEKVPEALRSIAEMLIAPVKTKFEEVIAEYKRIR
jgi:hypothetical protein